MTFNLRKLISVASQLSFQACSVMESAQRQHSFKSYMKGQDDPVTDADLKIQSMLIKGIKIHFPDIKIIGQESEQSKQTINYDYCQLKEDILPSSSNIRQNLQYKKACLWIDPIDCTRGFINGNIQDVTVLIGLSYQNKPKAGIIATPFKKKENAHRYDPIVTVGSVDEKQAFDFTGGQWKTKQKKYKVNSPLVISTSNTRSTPNQALMLRTLRASNVKAGGSGRKIMMVANGDVDAMIYCQSWTHKWDSCAGDAIIKAMNGYFTTPWGNNITYIPDKNNTHNKQGMVAALDREVYQQCMDSIAIF